MKCSILFLCIIVSLQVSKLFSQEVVREEVEEMSKKVEAKKDALQKKQEELAQQITKQQEIVDQASGKQKEEELSTLKTLQVANNRARMSIDSLSSYLDDVAAKKDITVEDQTAAEESIKDADKAIEIIKSNLKSEFVPSEPTQTEQSQAQIEKLGLWDTFKLNIQSVFAQTKATLANFFGNREAVAAAHEDLVDIYDQLKDYSSKAQSASKLANLYQEFGDFGNAIAAQEKYLDAVINTDVSQTDKISKIHDIVTSLSLLRNKINENVIELGAGNSRAMLDNTFNIEAKINDFLGELGYKINKISAYEILAAKPTDTVDKIKANYEWLVQLYTPQSDYTLEEQQNSKEKLKEVNNAFKELFGSDVDNPDLNKRDLYDLYSSVRVLGFEIRKMTDPEMKAFHAQKASQKQTKQTDILDED